MADYAFLNDEPLRGSRDSQHAAGDSGDGWDEDVLGTGPTARGLAELIAASRGSAPFTVAVDAGWGMGKSSLMHQVAAVLEGYPQTECVWFNAWTAHGADALEGLLKSVLMCFDRSVLRRALNRVRENRTALRALRTAAALALGLLHAGRVVDELWSRMESDAATRNDVRQLIGEMARQWSQGGTGPGRRLLVVFVDDLDRCPDETVLAVCEAVKVYLDVPGLVFVLGCDQSRLAEAGAAGGSLTADYLEKIVQISFRVPAPDEARAAALVRQYARRSGTERFLTPGLATMVAERTGRNPRRIKRLINGLVMYQLDPRWAGVEPEAVIRAVLLQHLYPDFHRAAGRPGGTDLIGDFAQYYEARGMLRRRAVTPDDPRWTFLDGFADRWLLPPPDRADAERWDGYLELIESQLPPVFPELATDRTFVRLITELNALPYAGRLRELIRQGPAGPPPRRRFPPPSQQPFTQQPPPQQFLPQQPPQYPYPFEPPLPGPSAWPFQQPQAPPRQEPAAARQPGWTDEPQEWRRPRPAADAGGQAPPQGADPGESPDAVRSEPTGSYDYPRLRRVAGQDRPAAADRRGIRGPLPLRVLWVDNKPESVVHLVRELRQLGAEVTTALGTRRAVALLTDRPAPDMLISDTRREGDPDEGFRAVAEYRAVGYEGPVVFYTGQISGYNQRQAEEAGAVGFTNSWDVVVELLAGVVPSELSGSSEPSAGTP